MCFLHSCHGTAAVLKMNTGTESFVRPSMGSWMLYGLGTENPKPRDAKFRFLGAAAAARCSSRARTISR